MGPFRRYAVTMVFSLLALGTIAGLLEGQGMAAFIGSAFGFVWVGWIVVLVGLPLFTVMLWALPRAFRRFPNTPHSVVGLATGLATWAMAAVLLGGVAATVSETGPGATSATPLSLLGFGLAIGAFGALLGLIESRYSWRA